MDDNIALLMALNSACDNNIMEIGQDSTTGVNYAKFNNGLALQWGYKSGIKFEEAVIVSGNITLFIPYESKPTAFISASTTANSDYLFRCGISPSNDYTKLNWTLASGSGTAISVTSRQFTWFVIGKWK